MTETMTIEELAQLGRDMRNAQNKFFRRPKDCTPEESGILRSAAQSLERMFDAAVKAILDPPKANLFNGGEA